MGRLVIVLAGPPGVGKTSWSRAAGLRSLAWEDYTSPAAWRTACLQVATDPHARVVVERCAPTIAERVALSRLVRADHVWVLVCPAAVCHQRVEHRGRPDRRGEHVGITAWFRRYQTSTMHPAPPDPTTIPAPASRI